MPATADETGGSPPAAYEELLERYERITHLQEGLMYLHWDQQVKMPEGGAPARAKQLSTLMMMRHEETADQKLGALLEELDEEQLDDAQAANVREVHRQHERAADVPAELVERLTEIGVENIPIWQQAKQSNDFDSFAPRLELLRDGYRDRAEYIDPDKPPYEVLYEDNHPYLPLEQLESIFDTLRSELPPLVEDIAEAEPTVDLAEPLASDYPDEAERAASEAVLDFIGFDRDRGRLDTAPHPFMVGTQFDVRISTQFNATPLDSLTSTIHEYGHASYELGLPKRAHGTPLGQSRRSIHESQSRFWENHIGRTKPFWEAFLPTFSEHIDTEYDVQEMYEAINQVKPDNVIRREADELTYHLHIILRCEIDRAFVNGEIEAEEIPAVWNEKMDEYLGVQPETDTAGCLQDIHWARGFANFWTYTLGSVIAAQLDEAIRDDLDVDALAREGDFDPIRSWMREHVHQHGQRYRTAELIERATGEPLSAEPFIEYVSTKFGELYDL